MNRTFLAWIAAWLASSVFLMDGRECLAQVEVVEVTEAAVSSGYRVVGSVVPRRRSTIGSAAAGRVAEFFLKPGQSVKAGQPVAQLLTETLKIELAAAEAQLELNRQQLAELVNGSREEDVAEAEANALGARAARENASSNLERMMELSRSGAATLSDLEDARERATFTRYTHAAAEATLARVRAGARPEQIAAARAQVELQQQNVFMIEDRIRKHTIVSPFDGFIAADFTEVGAWINSGDPVVEVVELSEVEVHAPITAELATKLRRGDTIRIEFPELPDQLLTGQLDRIIPIADPRARTFPAVIRLKNQTKDGVPMLMAGMLARVELPAGDLRQLPLVPKDALVLNASRRAVFVAERSDSQEAIVREVPVELGVAVGDMIQVIGDLKAGDLVVVVGNERLAPGMKVAILQTAGGSAK